MQPGTIMGISITSRQMGHSSSTSLRFVSTFSAYTFGSALLVVSEPNISPAVNCLMSALTSTAPSSRSLGSSNSSLEITSDGCRTARLNLYNHMLKIKRGVLRNNKPHDQCQYMCVVHINQITRSKIVKVLLGIGKQRIVYLPF
jgi:hypothetical protein